MRTQDEWLQLLEGPARRAAEQAYCPYSRFRVGAAVLTEIGVVTGCNIENASYGLTMCAERVALFLAWADGAREFHALCVVCLDAADDAPEVNRMPCGACRQVMAEFAEPGFVCVVPKVGVFGVHDLLPHPFELRTQ